ncbi:MAG: PH domain-containing protein [Solirubrobacteraceae bacterium]
MSVPGSERREQVVYSGHPSWRSMLDFHLAGLVLAALAGLIGKLASGWGIAVAAFAAVLALSVLVGYIRRVATHYTITDRRLHIRRGILSRIEQHTTIDRVQNVETHQSLLERVLRIGTVSFDTAGTEDSDFSFEGVASPRSVVRAVDRAQEEARTVAGSAGEPL